MGAASSVTNNYAFKITKNEYERIQMRISFEKAEGLEDYECLPVLSDKQLQIRLKECYEFGIIEAEKDINDCKNPCVIGSKMAALSAIDKKSYMENVVLAAIDHEKKNFVPKAAAADYSKSFSGSAADTKAEKEAAALMKGEGGTKEEEEEVDDSTVNPYLRKPKLSKVDKKTTLNLTPDEVEEETKMRKAFEAHDKHILQSNGLYLKFLGASGCYVYIHSNIKDVVSLRPRDYDEDDDIGGGIALANEQIAAEENKGKSGKIGSNIFGDTKVGSTDTDTNTNTNIPEGMMSCTLQELPSKLDHIIDNMKKTPIILDTSLEQKVRVFMEYKHRLCDISAFTIPFAKSGLKRNEVLENCRKTLVGALKSGTTFALNMGDCNIEHADFKKKLCKPNVFPVDVFQDAGKRLFKNDAEGEPRYEKLFRDDDKEAGQCSVREETFRTLVISSLSPNEWYEKLKDCIPTGYLVPLYITE